MSIQIQFAIEGELQLSRRLTDIAGAVQDWGPAFEQSVTDLKETFSNAVFETEGRKIDEAWSPLSRAYALRKEKLYPGKGILERTGVMRQAFASSFNATSATIWNTAAYFKYHQSNQPRHVLPRRVMMKLTENLKEMVVENFNVHMRNILTA